MVESTETVPVDLICLVGSGLGLLEQKRPRSVRGQKIPRPVQALLCDAYRRVRVWAPNDVREDIGGVAVVPRRVMRTQR